MCVRWSPLFADLLPACQLQRLVDLANEGLAQAKAAAEKEEAEAAEAEAVAAHVQGQLEAAERQGDKRLAAAKRNLLVPLVESARKERAEADAAASNRGKATGGLLEDLGDAYRALGNVHLDNKQVRKALDCARHDLKLQEDIFGAHASQVVMPLLGLSQSLQLYGKAEEAQAHAEKALRIAEDTFGPYHMDTAYCRGHLAMSLMKQGEYRKADPIYRQALEDMKEPEHPEYATVQAAFSENCLALGKKKDAREAYEAALLHADWS